MPYEDPGAASRQVRGWQSSTDDAAPTAFVEYDGRMGDVAKIALINGLLGLITLGFYRFWGKTRLRRYLWGRVMFQNDPFEYNGTGMELFVGFLVAIAIFVPLGLIMTLAELAFPTNETALLISALAQLIAVVYLIQFAIYRARRWPMR